MEQAIPLEFVDFDPNVEETGDISTLSAEQYLSWVRTQAQNLPSVVRVEVDSSKFASKQTVYMPTIESIPICPENCLPDDEWIRSIVHSFSDLRMSILRSSALDDSKERKIAVPQLKDRESWHKFCFGEDLPQCPHIPENPVSEYLEVKKALLVEQFDIASSSADCTAIRDDEGDEAESVDNEVEPSVLWQGATKVIPSTALMLQFDQVLTQRLLGYHIDWLAESAGSAGGTTFLTELRSQWLYSLLSRLEKPLHADMTAAIRLLYRTCCQMRAGRGGPAVDCMMDNSNRDFDEQEIARLNILISICGLYFGQGEEFIGFTGAEGVDERGEESAEREDEDSDDDFEVAEMDGFDVDEDEDENENENENDCKMDDDDEDLNSKKRRKLEEGNGAIMETELEEGEEIE